MTNIHLITNEELQAMLNDLQDPEKRDRFFAVYDDLELKANPRYRKEQSEDRRDLLWVITEGWYEGFDRFDSDLAEQFISTYEATFDGRKEHL